MPTPELYRLRTALTQSVKLVGSNAARELLVKKELQQREVEDIPDTRRVPEAARPPAYGFRPHWQDSMHGPARSSQTRATGP